MAPLIMKGARDNKHDPEVSTSAIAAGGAATAGLERRRVSSPWYVCFFSFVFILTILIII